MIVIDSSKMYSETKEELRYKVANLLLAIESKLEPNNEIDKKVYEVFSKWLYWFDEHYNVIKIPQLNKGEYLRAFFEVPNFFAVQVWKSDEKNINIRYSIKTLYANKYDFDIIDDNTELLEIGNGFKLFVESNKINQLANNHP